jgi:predicted ATP-dependent Lon-type protease
LAALRQRIEDQNVAIDSLGAEHFEDALKRVSPSVKMEEREYYRRLKEKFQRGKLTSATEQQEIDDRHPT